MNTKRFQGRQMLRLLLIILLLLPATGLLAQQKPIAVKGFVSNASNEPIPGVSVILRNNSSNFTSGTSCDSAGVFTFSSVPPAARTHSRFPPLDTTYRPCRGTRSGKTPVFHSW